MRCTPPPQGHPASLHGLNTIPNNIQVIIPARYQQLSTTRCSIASLAPPSGVLVRRATLDDIQELAAFSSKAAAAVELLRFDSVRSNPGSMQGVIAMLETQLASRWEQELTTQLTAALRAKQNCTAEARAYRLHRASVRLRAQLMALQNQRTSLLPPVTPEERRQLAKWRRARQFHCLVAEDSTTETLFGAVTLSLATPEARLPPPLPTKSPLRAYVSNMSVAPQHRRRGIATSLLQSCERIGVPICASNTPAQSLYEGAGYSEVGDATWWQGGRGRVLMRKSLVPLKWTREEVVGGEIGEDGVFVWETPPIER